MNSEYIPFYHRPPNTFIRHESRRFDDGHGNSGTCLMAIFKDRKGNICEETAQVIWDDEDLVAAADRVIEKLDDMTPEELLLALENCEDHSIEYAQNNERL